MWLFTDRAHYDFCMKTLYNNKSYRASGGYIPCYKAIVMDISVGNGILVHETVHAFIHANFPRCPVWFNEGLASLYNRCREENGEMRGCPDGTVVSLQRSICSRDILPFEELCALTFKEFHGNSEARNYAQSHYLCYYMQERDLLKEYYHAFYVDRRRDPTGYKTLQRLLAGRDMRQFQEDWEALVLAIAAPA